MPENYRVSRFIDFNKGEVFCDPMTLFNAQGGSEWSLKQKIDFFQCRVEVWQLSPAVEMLKQVEASKQLSAAWSHAAYGIVFIVTSYFEMVGKILNPNSNRWRTSDTDFNYGFCDAYPTLPLAQAEPGETQDYKDETIPHVAKVRDMMRNGMYHLGFTKKNFEIHNSPTSPHDFEVQPVTNYPSKPFGFADLYLMNPHQVTRTLVEHFGKFIDELRLPANAARQQKFLDFVDKFHEENPTKS
jgi:hypothetical protein